MSGLEQRITEAYKRADATAEDGHEWTEAFDQAVFDVGLEYAPGFCNCERGDFGHMPHCGLRLTAGAPVTRLELPGRWGN